MHPKYLSIQDFTYHLPDNRIAQHPLADRDASRLLVYKDGNIAEDIYRNIAAHIPAGSLLVFNNTKVVEARLKFKKPSGGSIEIFCLSPHSQYHDVTAAMLQKEKVWWNCLIGGASKWKPGMQLEKIISAPAGDIVLKAAIVERSPENFVVELSWQPDDLSFAEILHYAGEIPLPPYMKRGVEKEDEERYQTIYAEHHGSVAAPTAGLHFTDGIFASFAERNINTGFVTLHVGAGTFKPVKAAHMHEHAMHAEFIEVAAATIEQLSEYADNIICVGTTSLRTIESLYWAGVKIIQQPGITEDDISINQWEVYDALNAMHIPVKDALNALLKWLRQNNLQKLVTQTQILIAPGYDFRMIKGLITNFHQPQSTLLLLVAAIIGDDWRGVYEYALENNFRFLSYGDGCLLFI
ncbi:MAG: S-adenosylmethionine:tRNA ribosyltransferase-isomerase [Terrimonas sp.]|nr:S-adenosylmethionine:tRNA ribosyltransferase-isomerase [Terrimonas sp.]OJY99115.1 MAG: S-adenosylmethionine tRNA ribosyltransferase [Sphingobacteriales bacterium 40-81]